MVLIFSTGLGLALLGCLNALLRRKSSVIRVPLSFAVIGASSGLSLAITGVEVALLTSMILGGVWAVQMLAGSAWLAKAIASAAAACRSPVIRWGAIAVFGLGAAIASVLQEEAEFAQRVDDEMSELDALTAPPQCEVPSVLAMTDIGHEIAIREAIAPRSEREMLALEDVVFSRPGLHDAVIRRGPGSDASNCHGWVFTGARYWITGSQVDRIIAENSYQVVAEPRAGDLVVYRSATGDVLHSAVVRYVSGGMPVLVEGKWGPGGVYLHPVEKSVYGTRFQYYRSSRNGHILAGLNPTDSNRLSATEAVPASAIPLDPDEITE